jgi:hypothetical protein
MIYRKGEEEVEKGKKSGPTKYIYRDHVKTLRFLRNLNIGNWKRIQSQDSAKKQH